MGCHGGLVFCVPWLLTFAFYVVGNLVDLVKDIAVALYKFRDLIGGVLYGRVVTAAECAPDLW